MLDTDDHKTIISVVKSLAHNVFAEDIEKNETKII